MRYFTVYSQHLFNSTVYIFSVIKRSKVKRTTPILYAVPFSNFHVAHSISSSLSFSRSSDIHRGKHFVRAKSHFPCKTALGIIIWATCLLPHCLALSSFISSYSCVRMRMKYILFFFSSDKCAGFQPAVIESWMLLCIAICVLIQYFALNIKYMHERIVFKLEGRHYCVR